MNLDWQQKLAAMMSIAPDAHLKMKEPGSWYLALPGVEIKSGSVLRSANGRGDTPEAAILDGWDHLTIRLGPTEYVVTAAMRDDRRSYRWNGFMWAAVEEVAA
jgi:hypothetical protein